MTAKITEYRPDGRGNLSEQVIDLDTIRSLPVQIDHVKVTADGRLEIKLSGKVSDDGSELHKIRELLLVIRDQVLVDFRPAQESLPM